MNESLTVYDFDKNTDLSNWYVVDDRVMGGVSKGNLTINAQGHAEFKGRVSLENNGGFSSIRYFTSKLDVSGYATIVLRVRGDKKPYQLRIKSNSKDRESFASYFETTGEWETIKIKFSDLYPIYRGQKLKMSNYQGEIMNELSFLIGNKKAESFQLEIDWIMLK